MSKAKKAAAILVAIMMVIGTIVSSVVLGAAYGCVVGGISLLVVGIYANYASDGFCYDHFVPVSYGTSILAVIIAAVTAFLTSNVIIGVITALVVVLVIVTLTLGKQKLQTALAVLAIVGFISMLVLPINAAPKSQPQSQEDDITSVSIDQYNELLEKLDELTSENEDLKLDLEEALNANEELRRLYEEHKARCGNCPICNGTMTLEELEALKNNKNAVNGTAANKAKGGSSTPATSGAPLGDGQGNGAGTGGTGSVTPIYDPSVPKPGDSTPVVVVTPTETVDLTDDDGNDRIVVDDQHGGDTDDDDDDDPKVELDDEGTQKLTYSIDGNIITVKAPKGFKAVSEPLYYLVGSDNVKVINATADANTLKIEFEASADAKITICKGMFKKGDVKTKELVIKVSKTEKPAEEDPKPEKPGTEDPKPEQPVEMKVSEISVAPICDNGYEGDSLQFAISAVGENIEYTKFNVSIGSVSSDGTWTFAAPSESGTATISYGDVSQSVNFTVNEIGTNNESEAQQPGTEDPKPENPGTETENPGTETPAEMKITSINVAPICNDGYEGDSLQFEVKAEGENVNYNKFNVSVGSVSADGTWTFAAPSESGTATISYGDVSQSVNFTVNKIGTNDESEAQQPGTETEKPAEEETPSESEAPAEEETPSESEAPAEEETPSESETPAEEEIPSEPEKVAGTLTGISMFDSSVICGSDIQGEIFYDGDIDWSEVSVSGLNGLSYDISSDGTITIHTSEVASNYVITVSYNGSSVTAEFAVEGVDNPDIVW
ncbi:MAG: hypothetical protein Q4D02_00335 [Clostridia bacterium]|nr:hypothetical protein [Clostridia bacterium]